MYRDPRIWSRVLVLALTLFPSSIPIRAASTEFELASPELTEEPVTLEAESPEMNLQVDRKPAVLGPASAVPVSHREPGQGTASLMEEDRARFAEPSDAEF